MTKIEEEWERCVEDALDNPIYRISRDNIDGYWKSSLFDSLIESGTLEVFAVLMGEFWKEEVSYSKEEFKKVISDYCRRNGRECEWIFDDMWYDLQIIGDAYYEVKVDKNEVCFPKYMENMIIEILLEGFRSIDKEETRTSGVFRLIVMNSNHRKKSKELSNELDDIVDGLLKCKEQLKRQENNQNERGICLDKFTSMLEECYLQIKEIKKSKFSKYGLIDFDEKYGLFETAVKEILNQVEQFLEKQFCEEKSIYIDSNVFEKIQDSIEKINRNISNSIELKVTRQYKANLSDDEKIKRIRAWVIESKNWSNMEAFERMFGGISAPLITYAIRKSKLLKRQDIMKPVMDKLLCLCDKLWDYEKIPMVLVAFVIKWIVENIDVRINEKLNVDDLLDSIINIFENEVDLEYIFGLRCRMKGKRIYDEKKIEEEGDKNKEKGNKIKEEGDKIYQNICRACEYLSNGEFLGKNGKSRTKQAVFYFEIQKARMIKIMK